MQQAFTLTDLADKLSLEFEADGGPLRVTRHDRQVELPAALGAQLDASTPLGRHLTYAILFALRLSIDRLASDFDMSQERPEKPERVFHPHEMPSMYGNRLPWLVPRLCVEWIEALTDERVVTSDWLVDGLAFVYILETGRHLHVLTEADLAQLDFGREKLLRDARHALFYDSYKLKPRDKKRTEAGLVRIFRTVEGMTAGRAMLLPDYDYDAARERGCFATPSRDTMIIGRPSGREYAEQIFEQVSEICADLVASEPFPLSSMVCRLTTEEVELGEFVAQPPLPAHGAALDDYRPPDDLDRIE